MLEEALEDLGLLARLILSMCRATILFISPSELTVGLAELIRFPLKADIRTPIALIWKFNVAKHSLVRLVP